MSRNPSRHFHQMSVVAPTLEVCLLPHDQPDFTPFSPSSSPSPSFFLTPDPLFWQPRGHRMRPGGSQDRSNLHRGSEVVSVPVQQER